MNVLTFSTRYPNRAQPVHGLFVERRLLKLVASGRIRARVVAPVPWFPFGDERFGSYGAFARVPRAETRSGIAIHHPRYLLAPKIGMTLAPILMALATLSLIRRMHTAAAIDVIDAHYIYPDGVAAALVAGWLGVPFTVTARGSDVNLLGRYALQRRMIRWAASRAGAVIAVSGALRQALMALGCLAEKIHVLQNGVDLEEFRTLDRAAARRELGINGTTLLSVGKLDENKGHHLVIEALHELPGVRLMVVGTGPWQGRLEQQARSQDLQGRVTFLGSVTPERLRICYNAADALVLASGREGMPNVVLESLACGTRVIAHGVGGVPDIIDDAIAGRLLESRSSAAIARVARELLAVRPDPPATRKYAERFGWSRTVQAQLEVLGSVLAQGNGAVSGGDPGATRRA